MNKAHRQRILAHKERKQNIAAKRPKPRPHVDWAEYERHKWHRRKPDPSLVALAALMDASLPDV